MEQFDEENDIDIEVATHDDCPMNESTADFLDDNIKDDDLVFEIPKTSRIILQHGSSSLSDSDWMRPSIKTNIQVDYFSQTLALKQPFKYMSAKIIESNETLNDYLDEFVYDVKAKCRQLSEKEIQDVDLRNIITDLADEETLMTKFTLKTAVETYYIGRIRYNYANKRLNSRNLYLESSTTYCFGDVVPLDISLFMSNEHTDESNRSRLMSLFPGQIVIIKAQNPTGNFMRVTRFIDLSDIFEANFSPMCPKVLLNHEPVTIVCASGPFVSMDPSDAIDLTDTTYMRALADYLKSYNPDVLFIFGPFFDEAQSDIIAQWSLKESVLESSTLPYQWTIEKLFNHQFRALSKELEGQATHTQIIYIPSATEFGSANIFPTYPTEIKQVLPIQSFSNPSMLSLGGISIGAISTDILMHMSRHEISNISREADQVASKKLDRLQRLSSHMLEHKSFYPLLPPDRTVNLEYSMYNHLAMPTTPHLLLVPSILRPFIYNIDNTIVVNPGKVAKNSIARIMIDPLKDTASYTGSLAEYVNVEIIKLIFDSNKSNSSLSKLAD